MLIQKDLLDDYVKFNYIIYSIIKLYICELTNTIPKTILKVLIWCLQANKACYVHV